MVIIMSKYIEEKKANLSILTDCLHLLNKITSGKFRIEELSEDILICQDQICERLSALSGKKPNKQYFADLSPEMQSVVMLYATEELRHNEACTKLIELHSDDEWDENNAKDLLKRHKSEALVQYQRVNRTQSFLAQLRQRSRQKD